MFQSWCGAQAVFTNFFCRCVVMVPDPNMEQKDTLLADEVLQSLQDFDPSHWGLPPFTD